MGNYLNELQAEWLIFVRMLNALSRQLHNNLSKMRYISGIRLKCTMKKMPIIRINIAKRCNTTVMLHHFVNDYRPVSWFSHNKSI